MAQNTQYSGGALFKVESANVNAPVQQGDIVIQRDLLKKLVDAAKAGREAKLKVTCWRRTSKRGGKPFLSVDIEEYGEWERGREQARGGGGGQSQQAEAETDDPFGSDNPWS